MCSQGLHKIVTLNPGDERVLCKNPTCKRNMFVSRCKKANNKEELLLTDKEDETKQIRVTSFDQTLVNVIDMNKKESENEDDLLPLKDYDIPYKKKITVKSIFNQSNAYKIIVAVIRVFFAKICFK